MVKNKCPEVYKDKACGAIYLVYSGYAIAYNEDYSEERRYLDNDYPEIDVKSLLDKSNIMVQDRYHDYRYGEFIERDDDFISVKALEKFVRSVKRKYHTRKRSYLLMEENRPYWEDMVYKVYEDLDYTVNGELLLDTIRCVTDKDFVRVKIPNNRSDLERRFRKNGQFTASRFKPMYIDNYDNNNFGVVLPVLLRDRGIMSVNEATEDQDHAEKTNTVPEEI